MSQFTEETKRQILDDLARMNELLRAAGAFLADGKFGDSVEAIKRAIDYKLLACARWPSLRARRKLDVPFFAVYALFHDIDSLATVARTRLVLDKHVSAQTITAAEIRSRLRTLLDELERTLLGIYKPSTPEVLEILEDVRQKLRDIDATLRGFEDGKPVDLTVFDGLSALKKEFFECFASDASLWDAYALFHDLDWELEQAVQYLARYRMEEFPAASEAVKLLGRRIATVEATRRKLEALVAGIVPGQSPELDAPGSEGPPVVPDPQYPPGSNDLPPFPPNLGLASARVPSTLWGLDAEDADVRPWPDLSRRPEDRPPVIFKDSEPGLCKAKFVHGIDQQDCDPREEWLPRRCRGTIHGFIFPGSKWEAEPQLAADELGRSIGYYRSYCIELELKQLQVAARDKQRMQVWWDRWLQAVTAATGGADHLGTTTIPTALVDEFVANMGSIQKLAKAKGATLLVLFMDHYLGGSSARVSLVSSTQEKVQQIGISWIDRQSPFILAHELIHALGKSGPSRIGPVTWNHRSPCNNSLSFVARTTSTPVDFSGRYLEWEEYKEIVANRGGVLDCPR